MQCFTGQISFLKTDYEILRGFHALRIELFHPADLTILAFFHTEAPMNTSQVIIQSKITWSRRVSCKLSAGFSKTGREMQKSIIDRISVMLAEIHSALVKSFKALFKWTVDSPTECHFGVYFSHCFTTQKINTKIIPSYLLSNMWNCLRKSYWLLLSYCFQVSEIPNTSYRR